MPVREYKMKKSTLLALIVLMFVLFVSSANAQVIRAPMQDETGELEVEYLKDYRKSVWENLVNDMFSNEQMIRELSEYKMTYGDAVMRFAVDIAGEKPEAGYPLYIALHGGGWSDTPDINDSQWQDMMSYYFDELECGIYIAVRGVRDTWDTHFNPESYPLYDRLIEYLILTGEVDPNRVYLEGFSAGGDGVYQISARMPDRFAAVNMSSGHPNDVSIVNLFNLPIQLQAGEFDEAYDRNTMTAVYGLRLDSLESEFPGGYEHRTLIHYDRGHNYEDYDRKPAAVMADVNGWLYKSVRDTIMADSFPPDYMDVFTRNPIPDMVRWDLDTRAELRETNCFYYLMADRSARGTVFVTHEKNAFFIDVNDLEGDFWILFNEDMIDFNKPVHFELENGSVDAELVPEMSWLEFTTQDRSDPNFQFEAAVSYQWLLDNISAPAAN